MLRESSRRVVCHGGLREIRINVGVRNAEHCIFAQVASLRTSPAIPVVQPRAASLVVHSHPQSVIFSPPRRSRGVRVRRILCTKDLVQRLACDGLRADANGPRTARPRKRGIVAPATGSLNKSVCDRSSRSASRMSRPMATRCRCATFACIGPAVTQRVLYVAHWDTGPVSDRALRYLARRTRRPVSHC